MANKSFIDNLSRRPESERIAQVDFYKNKVFFRQLSSPLWHDVARGEKVYQFDKIFTDKNSSAKLTLVDDLGQLNIGERTLFTIQYLNGLLDLSLLQGKLSGVFNFTNKVRIRLSKNRYILTQKNTILEVIKNNGPIKVKVIKGGIVVGEKPSITKYKPWSEK